jgi:hypothetical protein
VTSASQKLPLDASRGVRDTLAPTVRAIVLGLVIAGCGGPQREPHACIGEPYLDNIAALRDPMCACVDQACVMALDAQLRELMRADPPLDRDCKQQSETEIQIVEQCERKLDQARPPPSPPTTS